jgi:hypothetical protein
VCYTFDEEKIMLMCSFQTNFEMIPGGRVELATIDVASDLTQAQIRPLGFTESMSSRSFLVNHEL